MPDIPISAETYKDLEELAVGFDTPESVIKRLVKEHKQKTTSLENKPSHISNTSPKGEVTHEMLKEVYRIAKDVMEWRKKLDDALNYLEKEIGMNKGYASILIKVFKSMRTGERYTRTISLPATRYFLEQILTDYDKDGLRIALNALKRHIEYYEECSNKQSAKSLQEIHAEFFAKLQRVTRKAITIVEIREIYKKAKEVFEAHEKDIYQGREALGSALDYLEKDVGMNRGSAQIYIKVFLTLKRGELHKNKMSVNDVAAEYFLKNILADDGKKGLKIALDSLWLYIEYREGMVGSKMLVFRQLHKEYSAKLD